MHQHCHQLEETLVDLQSELGRNVLEPLFDHVGVIRIDEQFAWEKTDFKCLVTKSRKYWLCRLPGCHVPRKHKERKFKKVDDKLLATSSMCLPRATHW